MQTQFANRLSSNPSGRMGLIALFVAVLTWLAVPQAAWAATFTVTKTADTNDGACNADCSLREAIVAANAAPGADVITLPAGTYTLSRSGVDNSAVNGDLDVTGPLTINGAAQATTIIEAGASGPTAIDRVFSFNPLGSATGFAVALNNLTIRNGKNPNAFATQENDGGCFDFDGGTTGAGSLSLTNVTVSNCETTDGSGGGAAIFLPKGGTINFSGTTIQNNIASRGGTNFGDGGGLIFSCVQAGGTSTVTIANSTISGNSTRSLGGNNSGSGGGIVNFGVCTPGTATANMLLRAVTISGNSTGADGGGIFSGGALTIDNTGGPSVISNNSAGRSGGGIWLNHPNTTSTISKVTFSGNSAGDDGGAIRLGSSTPGNVLNVSFSRFINNTAASGKASGLSVYNGNATATNNWWGCSTGPSAAPCDTAKLDPATGTTGPLGTGTINVTPWLRVNVTAATNPLVTGQSTGLTASILTDSNGGAVALSNLTLLLGQPVTWSGVGGTISGQQTTIQANGTATANYQATAAAAGNLAVAKVDNDGTTTGSNVRAITVNKANTTATITADTPDPSVSGQAVTVSYNVTVNSPGAGTPTGNVTISDGINSCTGTVAAGQCALTFASAGAKLLTATYVGDNNFFPSTSTAVPHTVNKAATTTTISADTPDPSTVGQAVTVSYNVTVNAPGAGTPTGNVTISDGVDSCTATVADGQCVITLTTTGARTLTATYAGDSNFNGSTSTGEAHTVNVATQAPQITTQPTNQSICAGATATFSAAASGTPAPTVQWQISSDNGATWNDLSGETNPTLNVVTSAADNGKQYRALFTNSAGSATSNAATLTVNSAPAVTTQPGNQTVNEGQAVSFSAAASGSPAPTVQWQVSTDNGATWSNLAGETDTTLTFTAQSGDNGKQFRVVFTNGCNSATSNAATLTVNMPDTTAPVITLQVNGTLGNSDWYISDVTVSWSVVDDESAISSQSGCETQNVTGDTASVTFTCSATSSGGSSSESVTVKRDATAPVVTVTGVSDGASYTLGSVPAAGCSTTDALSGVVTQATVSVTGGNPDGTGSFTATCSGATDLAGNSGSASASYTVTAAADACTTTMLRDDFNRANGGLGSNWAGLTGQSFYKIASNQVDVQLGGPVVWKPTTFGVNQAAFVTLSTLDANSPSQGVLLKVQGGTIPNAGAISVVYDSRAKAVRVSTLRLNTPAWTVYGHTPATFANGDKLLGCVQADGTVRVYQNNSLLTTVTLNAADQSFFNTKGGKIGLWTVTAFNAFFDDFGGGALTGVVSATLDAPVPDELADDGAEITVAENFPTDDTAVAPEADTFANRAFLPLVNR